MPADNGVPDMSEFASMGNCIADGKTFEDCMKEDGIPDTPLFREYWDRLKQGLEKTMAEGKAPHFDFD